MRALQALTPFTAFRSPSRQSMPSPAAPMAKKRKQVEKPSKAKLESEPGESEPGESESESEEAESNYGERDSENGEEESDSGEAESESGESSPEPESGSESDSQDGAESEEIVNVDFQFFDPKKEDFHGVKALLKVYLDDTNWDLSGFVDVVLAQTTVGSVIKTDDEDTPIGVVTALNLARYGNLVSLKEVREFLLKQTGNKQELLALWDQTSARHVGLIVSERVINVPIELVTPLFTGLFDEIGWAVTDEPTVELRTSFDFERYLILTRVYEEISSSSTRESSHKKKGKKHKPVLPSEVPSSQSPLIYPKGEDEIFHSLCSWSFTFPVKAEALAAHESKGMRQLRLVMVVEASKIPTFKTKLKDLCDTGV